MIRARLSERVTRARAGTVSRRDRLEIVWIDQAPLRANAAAECTDMMVRLERARLGWHQFERQDKPAFVRWRAREFGALLSTARDVEDKIRDAQNLIHEVEIEMRRHIQDPHSAYRRVLFRRENPGVADERETFSYGSQSTPHLSEFEQEALFQEWVRTFLGTNPTKMDDDVYSSSFEVFKSHMFVRPESAPSRSDPRPAGVRRSAVDEESAGATEPVTIDPRVKESIGGWCVDYIPTCAPMGMRRSLRFGMKSRRRMWPVTLPAWNFCWRSVICRTRPALAQPYRRCARSLAN